RAMPCGFSVFVANAVDELSSVQGSAAPFGIKLTLDVTRILIIEDDPDIAELVRRYLEKAGFEIEVMASGRDGLAALTARPPDLLVLDLMLPHVSGAEICRAARAT